MIGFLIKTFRKRARINQVRFVKDLNLGQEQKVITQGTLSKIENDLLLPDFHILNQMRKVYGLSVDDFMIAYEYSKDIYCEDLGKEKELDKKSFVEKRTGIISKMLDSADKNGICKTSMAFAELDDIYDSLTGCPVKSWAQQRRDDKENKKQTKNRLQDMIPS